MPPRIFVVDGRPHAAAAIVELLGDRAGDVSAASRDVATDKLRAAHNAGAPFDVILLDGEPPPTAMLVRELGAASGGARVILIAAGPDAIGQAMRCGAADVVGKPIAAAELAFRISRVAAGSTASDKRRPRKSDVLIGSGTWI